MSSLYRFEQNVDFAQIAIEQDQYSLGKDAYDCDTGRKRLTEKEIHLPTSQLDDTSARRNMLYDCICVFVKGINLGVGKIVFFKICDILKQFQTFLCRGLSISSFLTKRGITII